jgi:hypothetical protein
MMPIRERAFVCYIAFIGWDNISLGLHLNWRCPNVEVHLPFCFIRVGWQPLYLLEGTFWDGVYGKKPKFSED